MKKKILKAAVALLALTNIGLFVGANAAQADSGANWGECGCMYTEEFELTGVCMEFMTVNCSSSGDCSC